MILLRKNNNHDDDDDHHNNNNNNNNKSMENRIMAHERWTPLRVEPTKTNESRVHVRYP